MSFSDIAIMARGLGKAYTIVQGGQRPNTAAEAVAQRLRNPFMRVKKQTFWALKDVSFDIAKGEVVGIIGRNGAGKSTLLKVLSHITEPTEGEAVLNGRIGSLLEVGTGFHPELTGRENIYLNGAILGMSTREIARQFEAIVEFAGVAEFLDTPVKRYSSGMYVRLAFSVAAHLNPEILIVDEVLAVGDADFQKKCLGKMQQVSSEGRTVLFVSHNIAVIQTLCKTGLLLRNGSVHADGKIDDVVAEYLRSIDQAASSELENRTDRRGSGAVRLKRFEVSIADCLTCEPLASGCTARFTVTATRTIPGLKCLFTIYDQYGLPVSQFDSGMNGLQDVSVDYDDGAGEPQFVCDIDELALVPGRYRVNAALFSGHELEDHVEGALIFDVEPGQINGRPVRPGNGYGSVHLGHRWSVPGATRSAQQG